MPSVGTTIAQPRGHSYAVTQGDWGAYFFNESDFDEWYADNASAITKLGSGLYIIPGTTSGTTFQEVLTGDGPGNSLSPGNDRIEERKTLLDMGKEIIIGNSKNSRLIVFRRVQKYSASTGPGSAAAGDNGYVLIENNCSDLGDNSGRFTIRVARM